MKKGNMDSYAGMPAIARISRAVMPAATRCDAL